MIDPIRAALEAAGQATCPTAQTVGGSCAPICLHCPRIAAKAIAAFLRSLPVNFEIEFEIVGKHRTEFDALADAVLAAAKDQAND